MKRVSTGISRVDEVLGGGFPENHIVLVSGSPGSGKTILSAQFLVEGARKGEKGLYISFEETTRNVKQQASEFGWKIDELEKKGLLRIVNLVIAHANVEKVLNEIEELVRKFKPQRMVLDSLSTLGVFTEVETRVDSGKELLANVFGEAIVRKAIMTLIERIKALEVTCILTSELKEGSEWYSRDTVSEFATDGVLKLSKSEATGRRTLTIVKMRATKHDFLPKRIEITDKGIIAAD